MNDLPSTEFRKAFARLTEPTTVSVHGHVIGTYVPTGSAVDGRYVDAIRPGEPAVGGFNTRPFTPAPKSGGKR